MNETHEVISAFLDDEPFDANTLGAALSDPEGRDLLIDLMSLRHLMQIESKNVPALSEHTSRRFALRALAAAAAILVALAGGYLVGERRSAVEATTAPPATRVVQAPAQWQELP
jgi:hypothetical protein